MLALGQGIHIHYHSHVHYHYHHYWGGGWYYPVNMPLSGWAVVLLILAVVFFAWAWLRN